MKAIKFVFGVLKETIRNYRTKHGFQNSAMIAYFATLSIIPFFFLIIALFGFVFHFLGPKYGSEQELLLMIKRTVSEIAPFISDRVIERLQDIINSRGTIGIVGFLFMFVAAGLVFEALEISLREIFNTPPLKHFILSRLFFFLFFAGIGFIFVIIYFILIISKSWINALGGTSLILFMSKYKALDMAISFVIVVMGFVIVVSYFARKKIKFKALAAGSVIFFLFFELARVIFTYYIEHFAKFNLIYGSLATLMIGIVWIYYSASIFLICAEFVNTIHWKIVISQTD